MVTADAPPVAPPQPKPSCCHKSAPTQTAKAPAPHHFPPSCPCHQHAAKQALPPSDKALAASPDVGSFFTFTVLCSLPVTTPTDRPAIESGFGHRPWLTAGDVLRACHILRC
jgi:hypothetical protein